MKGRRNPIIAREGLLFVGAALLASGLAWYYEAWGLALAATAFLAVSVLIFRDPHRLVPASPLGVVSPVDGRISEIGVSDCGVLNGEVSRLLIRIDSFGTYSARSPAEGRIMDLDCDLPSTRRPAGGRGLWVRTDENQDILLQFRGYRFGIPPRAYLGFGERVGQGQRCAYLRLTRDAELQLPLESRILVAAGQTVQAGTTLLARLPHP